MRRVVITGLGIVSPVGCGVETSWSNALAGNSGARRIEEFEVADLTCQIACFIPRGATADGKFNPDDWMEPKEQRKVDDFIIYAMAAAEQAIADSGFKADTPEKQETHGRAHRLGHRRPAGHRRDRAAAEGEGPAPRQPVLHSRASDQSRRRLRLDQAQAQGPEPRRRHGLLDRHARHRRCGAPRRAGRRRRDGRRRHRNPRSAASRMAGFAACRALSTGFNDSPTEASRPYDKDRDGFVMGEGAGVVVLEDAGACQGARRQDLRRGDRLRHVGRRLPHHRSGGERRRRLPLHARRAEARRDRRQRHRLRQRARHLDADGRRDRARRRRAPVRQRRRQARHVVDQVGRSGTCSAPPAPSRRSSRCWPSATTSRRRRSNLDNPSVETAIDLVPHTAKKREINTVLSNSFGFGGTNASLILRRVA